MPDFILSIDQGTTSTRAILFDLKGEQQGIAQKELLQIFPQAGWVEHDPEEIWRAVQQVCREAMAKRPAGSVRAIGITNQRETAVVWDRKTGKPIHNAIVWQDRRGAPLCRKLIDEGWEPKIQAKTGLLIDSYFSATKVRWMLDQVPGAQAAAERGELAMGTIDSFVLWRLTSGKVHATDVTNACRTMLFNIHKMDWDDELLGLFKVPKSMLPKVLECADEFGASTQESIGAVLPIAGIAGDQQAALIGQACFQPGMIKSTYGTGCFALLNTGKKPVASKNRLLTTVGYKIKGDLAYANEGSIFVAGAAVQWLRDGLKLIAQAGETEALARSIAGTGIAEIVRSALEAVCYQTRDLMTAMAGDAGAVTSRLRVDGGMVRNDWVMQFLADILNVPVERPVVTETTALGAAICAGLGVGLFSSLEEVAGNWQSDRVFRPAMKDEQREQLYAGWRAAVKRVQS
jgi:glycerol kinase